jgi:DnaJ-class molecular chaperone
VKCQRCQGKGVVRPTVPDGIPIELTPCPDCHGNGVADCCHGHEGQPVEDEE